MTTYTVTTEDCAPQALVAVDAGPNPTEAQMLTARLMTIAGEEFAKAVPSSFGPYVQSQQAIVALENAYMWLAKAMGPPLEATQQPT